MNEWRSVYDSEDMVGQYNKRLKIIGIGAEERDDVVLNIIPYGEHDTFRMLDLGAGIGRFTKKLREKYPHARAYQPVQFITFQTLEKDSSS
jgi:hypothetical protein